MPSTQRTWRELTVLFPACGDENTPANPREPFGARSPATLLETFDLEVAKAKQVMASTADTSATQPWRFMMNGKVRFEKPREAVFRDMTLSHLVHHRGQFSVYLRLLEVPVPGSYGPTADDRQ